MTQTITWGSHVNRFSGHFWKLLNQLIWQSISQKLVSSIIEPLESSSMVTQGRALVLRSAKMLNRKCLNIQEALSFGSSILKLVGDSFRSFLKYLQTGCPLLSYCILERFKKPFSLSQIALGIISTKKLISPRMTRWLVETDKIVIKSRKTLC